MLRCFILSHTHNHNTYIRRLHGIITLQMYVHHSYNDHFVMCSFISKHMYITYIMYTMYIMYIINIMYLMYIMYIVYTYNLQ